MDLEEPNFPTWRQVRLTIVHVNKVHHVQTIARVARLLGEDEDWLWNVATEMEPEHGLIWVYGPNDHGVMAFTDDGIAILKELIKIHKADPGWLTRRAVP